MVRHLLAVAALLLAGSAAPALEADDVVRMAKAKVGDEVILAQMQAAKARFVLTADDIVRLKKEGVSDAVLKAMIESAKAEFRREAPAEPERAPATRPEAGETGTLILENLDSRDYSLQVDPGHRNIFYYKASGAEGREPLPARSSQAYRLPAGTYRLTWVGGPESHLVRVLPGRESRATLTRTSGEGFEAVYLSLFEDGERRGGGKLITLADRAPAPTAPAESEPAAAPARIVEQRYYAAPAQQTYYPPVYTGYQPYYYDPGYRYSGYYWGYPSLGFDWSRGRNSYALGWGPYGDFGFSWHRRLGRGGFTLGWGW
jgi:hypothetical protein